MTENFIYGMWWALLLSVTVRIITMPSFIGKPRQPIDRLDVSVATAGRLVMLLWMFLVYRILRGERLW